MLTIFSHWKKKQARKKANRQTKSAATIKKRRKKEKKIPLRRYIVTPLRVLLTTENNILGHGIVWFTLRVSQQ